MTRWGKRRGQMQRLSALLLVGLSACSPRCSDDICIPILLLEACGSPAPLPQASTQLVAVDLVTGETHVVTSSTVGIGPDILNGGVVVVESGKNRALVVSNLDDRVIAADLTSGRRTVVSKANPNTPLNAPYSGVLDEAANRIVCATREGEVIAVDLVRGGANTNS